MFSGIVEGAGQVLRIKKTGRSARLQIRPLFPLGPVRTGESLAVNGCCLTIATRKKDLLEADLSHETLRVTNLGSLQPGDLVNLERPLRLNDRIGGHLVQGHVDGVGRIENLRKRGSSVEIEISFPVKLRRYLMPKGSIAVDGISMTVNRLGPGSFTLVVIPHTLKQTTLKAARVGQRVNLEVDLVGKYIESLLRP